MSRFVYCNFWHPGRNAWVDSYLNLDQIQRAQLDGVQTDKTRVWLMGEDAVGVLTDWDWTTAGNMLGVVAMTQPTTPQAATMNTAMAAAAAVANPVPAQVGTAAATTAPAPAA
jgi:hypothetical protein